MSPDPVGNQLSSAALHARQQQIAASWPGPTIVAVAIRNPVNIGTIFRVADAVACRRIIFVETAPRNNRRIRRISRATLARIPHTYYSLAGFQEVVDTLPPLVALEITSRSQDLFETELPREMTLVVGGEREGIADEILRLCTVAVHIPMFGINSSMNVATALGIALYEWYRQHGPG